MYVCVYGGIYKFMYVCEYVYVRMPYGAIIVSLEGGMNGLKKFGGLFSDRCSHHLLHLLEFLCCCAASPCVLLALFILTFIVCLFVYFCACVPKYYLRLREFFFVRIRLRSFVRSLLAWLFSLVFYFVFGILLVQNEPHRVFQFLFIVSELVFCSIHHNVNENKFDVFDWEGSKFAIVNHAFRIGSCPYSVDAMMSTHAKHGI